MAAIPPVERRQIQIARVLCIFFMMGVHVSPGPNAQSVISDGPLWWLGLVWIDVLGRASVAALSFVSGYLLAKTGATRSPAALMYRKFTTLIVPMMTWNLVFLILLDIKHELFGGRVILADLASLTGLTGPTANVSLWFLRDLFISLLLIRLALPVITPLLLVLLAVVAITDCAEPIVFRPAILLFAAMGAMAGLRSTLAGWLTLERAVLSAVALGAIFFMAQSFPAAHEVQAENLIRRGLLVLGVLAVAGWLAKNRIGTWLMPISTRIFETYLIHAALFGILWTGWKAVVGGPLAPSYALFFLAAPFAALVTGNAFGKACDRLPESVQIALRGKAVARVPVHARPA